MNTPLLVQDVQRALEPHGIDVVILPADTSTAVLAAQALNTQVATIVKSLLFMADGSPVLVLVPGDRMADPDHLRRMLLADRLRLARPAEVLEITGYAVGGVPPVGHRNPLPVLMDRALFAQQTVYAAAGAGNAIFPVRPDLLEQISQARVIDIPE